MRVFCQVSIIRCRFSFLCMVYCQDITDDRRETAVPCSVGEVRGPPQEVASTMGGQVD